MIRAIMKFLVFNLLEAVFWPNCQGTVLALSRAVSRGKSWDIQTGMSVMLSLATATKNLVTDTNRVWTLRKMVSKGATWTNSPDLAREADPSLVQRDEQMTKVQEMADGRAAKWLRIFIALAMIEFFLIVYA